MLIGVAEPTSISVDTFGTGKLDIFVKKWDNKKIKKDLL